MQSEQQQRIMGYFIEEAKDHLNTLEQGLLNLQSTLGDPEMVSEVFRAAHSVKGGAAMLGLGSIQQTSHRLEDCFKVLKECPIKVDQKLESLFLRVFDTLQELLEQLQGPFGLTDDKADELMAEVEPVFTQLNEHLGLLVSQAGGMPLEDVELAMPKRSVPVLAASTPKPKPQPAPQEVSALQLIFQSDVPARLREMLQLFKQTEQSSSREQLQAACLSLAQSGDQFDLPAWGELLEMARRAIASPDNSYRTLAPFVIRDIKQAQELVLRGRSAEIVCSESLKALVPAVREELSEPDLADLLGAIDFEDDSDILEFVELDLEADQEISLVEAAEPMSAVEGNTWFRDDTFIQPKNSISNLDFGGNLDPSYSNTTSAEFNTVNHEREVSASTHSADRNGPEVGIAELNSLADLFEGEVPDLGMTWQEEEVIEDSSGDLPDATGESNDFADLLFDPNGLEELALEPDFEDDDLSDLLNSSEQSASREIIQPIASTEDDLINLLKMSSDSMPNSLDSFDDLSLDSDGEIEEGGNSFRDSEAERSTDADASQSSWEVLEDLTDDDDLISTLLEDDAAAADVDEPPLDELPVTGVDGLAASNLFVEEPDPWGTNSGQDMIDPFWSSLEPASDLWEEVPEISSPPTSGDRAQANQSSDPLSSLDSLSEIFANPFISENLEPQQETVIEETGFDLLGEGSSVANPLEPQEPAEDDSLWNAPFRADFEFTVIQDDEDELLPMWQEPDLPPPLLVDQSLTPQNLDAFRGDSAEVDLILENEDGVDLSGSLDEVSGVSAFSLLEETASEEIDDLSGIESDLSDLSHWLEEENLNSPVEIDDDLDETPDGLTFDSSLELADSHEALSLETDLLSLPNWFEEENPDRMLDISTHASEDVTSVFDSEARNLADLTENLDSFESLFDADDASTDSDFEPLASEETALELDLSLEVEATSSSDEATLGDLALEEEAIDLGLDLEPGEALLLDEAALEQALDEALDLDVDPVEAMLADFDEADVAGTAPDLEIGVAEPEISSFLNDAAFSLTPDDEATALDLSLDAETSSTFAENLFDLESDSADLAPAMFDFEAEAAETEPEFDNALDSMDLGALFAAGDLPETEEMNEAIAFDTGLEFPELETSEAANLDDFAELGSLLAEAEPATTAESQSVSFDDFDDLNSFLFEEATSEPQTASSNLDDFADLDIFQVEEEASDLSEDVSLSSDLADDFTELDALLSGEFSPTAPDLSSDSIDLDDFADLEVLLNDELSTPELPPSNTFSSLTQLSETSDEFDDLEKLLEDADQTLGGAPSQRGGRGSSLANNRMKGRRSPGVLSDQTMRVSVKSLDNLNNLVGELVVNRNTLEQAEERLRQFLDNLLYQVQQLGDVGQRMRDLYERSLLESSLLSSRRSYHPSPVDSFTQPQSNHATGASFDALEMDRFTGFHTLSQEMIELIVRVRESASDIDFVVDETDQVTRNFRQITTQLQEGLNRSRMVPFAQTADRLPRAVRDISVKCGKQAELQIEGRETLIDKMILEQLYDPMTHLVNNAITHGIEMPEERSAAGKPPVGRITVRTFHQGNQTVISVTDDGAGIDPERVKRKAIERGLITPNQAQEMTRLDVYDLLFHHGFSTRDKADDFAGRGVGMDVVRTSLNEIRGVINIDSTVGKGTTFTVRLPLTLSISKALCCISNRARIAFPMDGVEDMLDVPKERIQMDDQNRPCIQWRDTLLPFQSLSDLLRYNRSLGRGSVYGGNQEDDIVSVVVLRSAGNFLALQVDQVLGEQEIVIKQLEGPVPKPVGVAGATVLGDGRIMPIADVLELIDLSMGRIRREAGSSLWEKDEEKPLEPQIAETDPTVLIVDDSITVRELLSMTFSKIGYRVEQARDGQEAWEKLRSGLPCDLVFCDIEMPRMDGLELLSRIQKDPTLNHLPIAMLTSRGADRHRQMAVQLGAKGYFTKPYLEEALLDAAQRMLKGEVLVGG